MYIFYYVYLIVINDIIAELPHLVQLSLFVGQGA